MSFVKEYKEANMKHAVHEKQGMFNPKCEFCNTELRKNILNWELL